VHNCQLCVLYVIFGLSVHRDTACILYIMSMCCDLHAVDMYEVCGIALNHPAYQSSVFTSEDGFQHSANLANDGHRNLMSCAVSDAAVNPWWMVNFEHVVKVTRVDFTSGVQIGKKSCV